MTGMSEALTTARAMGFEQAEGFAAGYLFRGRLELTREGRRVHINLETIEDIGLDAALKRAAED